MKLVKRIIPLFVIFGFLFILTSCGYNFYNDFKSKGAELENGNSFVVLTADEVNKKREDKNVEFVIIIGSSNNENSVTAISKIQNEFDTIGYKGVCYFVNAQEAIKYQSKGAELTKALGVKSINPGTDGIIFVEYNKSGSVVCDSSKKDEASKKFTQNGSTLSARAIADYIAEYFPVEA